MPSTDPNRDFAVEVARTLSDAGFTALWAGGCVRDWLLGHAPDDYDVATSARPEQVIELFGKRRTLAIGASFGVILVLAPRNTGAADIEVATFRTEGPYLDGRRPEHVAFASPEEDAQRRDFTINGMFYDPLGDRVLDYVGGRDDLERRIVRAIGDPRARFAEDKLRMLRAVRMTARFDFTLDPSTKAAAREMAGEIVVVSNERITQELKKMLVHVRRAAAMRLADDVRLLPVVLPELQTLLSETGSRFWLSTLAMLERLEHPRFELALATLLFHINSPAGAASPPSCGESSLTIVDALCRRMRLSNEERQTVGWLFANRRVLAGAPGWRLSRLKRLLAEPLVDDLLRLTRVAVECGFGDLASVEFCEHYLHDTPRDEIDPAPLLGGADLLRLGLRPGAKFKELIDKVRDAQLDGLIHTRDDAVQLVKTWLPPP
ncbi:MAG: CCA tRNA nucleotidyltransferase [Planctomycetaceae bacterium]|nr:CCA tRNA nucleotidyltransferase [Planctomycetaceae bacterium]